jgi:hypothetical protein
VVCGAPWSGRFACHAGIPTGIPQVSTYRLSQIPGQVTPKNVGTDADVAT